MLVDANQHVDREAAARAGVGFYGKNTMLITRRHGSWVVLGTLVTDVRARADAARSTPDCGSCTLCIDACPTGALDEPGVLDATRCLSYWTQAPTPIPEEYREALGDQVYGCDICQDVCPWNRGVEKRRAGEPRRDAEPHVSLVDWLRGGRRGARRALRPALRPAERPALPAPERARRARQRRRRPERALAERYAAGDDELLARARRSGRCERDRAHGLSCGACARPSAGSRWVRLGAVAVRGRSRSRLHSGYPAGYRALGVDRDGRRSRSARSSSSAQPARLRRARCRRLGLRRARLRLRDRLVPSSLFFSFEYGTPIRQVLSSSLVEAALRYGIARRRSS